MSLQQLQSDLNPRTGIALMPGRWQIESLIAWCREVAKHDAGELERFEEDALFDVMNSFIEKLLLAQDVDRHHFYRDHRDSLFDHLANEVDGIVRDELVARITGYGIDRVSSIELFRSHFPCNLGLETLEREADQCSLVAVHTVPAQ